MGGHQFLVRPTRNPSRWRTATIERHHSHFPLRRLAVRSARSSLLPPHHARTKTVPHHSRHRRAHHGQLPEGPRKPQCHLGHRFRPRRNARKNSSRPACPLFPTGSQSHPTSSPAAGLNSEAHELRCRRGRRSRRQRTTPSCAEAPEAGSPWGLPVRRCWISWSPRPGRDGEIEVSGHPYQSVWPVGPQCPL